MKLRLVALSALIVLTFAACSTAKVRVMPGDDGVNRVISRDIEKSGAEKASVDAAQEYCEKRNQQAYFINESSKYEGSMDENTRNTIRNASAAAMILGNSVHTGSYGTSGPSILGSAGATGHIMTSDRDYTSEVRFKCK